MDINKFWQIISNSRKVASDDMYRPCQLIREELGTLAPREIADFQKYLNTCIEKSYHWNVWGAAFLVRRPTSSATYFGNLISE